MTKSGIYCMHGDGRSWTDLATNIVMLNDVELDRDLEKLTGWGTAPQNLLPAFLHESTHHWCFLSPVGSTLAALHLRARRRAVQLLSMNKSERNFDLEQQLLDDVIRIETAEAYLRPLAEGLALFMEFDAKSDFGSSVFSLPLEMAMYFFTECRFTQTRYGVTPAIINMLRWMRLEERCLERKAQLFGNPFSLDSGGYLPGYLTVRNLWLALAENASDELNLLNETDLALMYIRSFFFDDFGLVATLLDPSTMELDSASAIAAHIDRRFNVLLNDVNSDSIIAYQKDILANDKRTGGPQIKSLFGDSLFISDENTNKASSLLQQIISEVNSGSKDELDDYLQIIDAQTLTNRDVMYLGSVAVEVEVDIEENYRVLKNSVVILNGKTRKGVEPGRSKGSLDLFFSMLSGYKYRTVSVSRGNETVATRFIGIDPDIKMTSKRFERFLANRERNYNHHAAMKELLEKTVSEGWIQVSLTHVREQLPQMVEDMYAEYGLRQVPTDKVYSTYDLLRREGLLPVLEWDRDLIEGVALLGLYCSAVSPNKDLVNALFKKAGLNLDNTLAGAKRCYEMYGIPRVMEHNGSILSFV